MSENVVKPVYLLKFLTVKVRVIKLIIAVLPLTLAFNLFAQVPQVPGVIDFAGMKLKVSEQARKDIQSDVDALYRNEKYFNIKLERVDLYFPIIERVLREEGVPEDFKYLVIQESSLISDAVSTSNAVGFWQFKQDAGEEVGLKINPHVDERMNIVASTRGAAKYLKKHNSYFNNWVHSLLAYYLGRGGAQSVVDPKLSGVSKMDVDKNTNWYILKFLAHKVAFENAVGKSSNPSLVLVEYTQGADKSLKEISHETEVGLEILEHYNKWLKKGKVPSDKAYTVILPIEHGQQDVQLVASAVAPDKENLLPGEKRYAGSAGKYPVIEGDLAVHDQPLLVYINGRPGIIAKEGDDIATLAALGGIKTEKFIKANDITSRHKVKEGEYFYFKAKKNNAPVHYHTVQPGENLWEISQMYSVKMNSILRKNRMSNSGHIKPGMVLWLRYIRPANEEVAYRAVKEAGHGEEIVQAGENTSSSPKPEQNQEAKTTFPVEKGVSRVEGQNQTASKKESPEKPVDVVKSQKDDTEMSIGEETLNSGGKEGGIPSPKKNGENKADLVGNDPENSTPVEPSEASEKSSVADKQENTEVNVAQEEFKADNVKFVNTGATGAAQANAEKETHVVQQGETLYGIAKNYSIPLQDLAAWNQLKYNDQIKIGQILVVKSPEKKDEGQGRDVRKPEIVQDEYFFHKVQAGETLYKIAREHNVTIKEVMEWNNKSDFNVALGEVIKIKKLMGN